MKKAGLYSVVGFLLGWGAPTGALFLRFLSGAQGMDPAAFVDAEWRSNAFFYWYMLLGTCSVLSTVGWLLGDVQDLKDEKNRERVGS